MEVWSDLLQDQVKKSLKQRWDFSDKTELQLCSDFLQIQVKKSLKQRWDFSDKNLLQLCSDFLQTQKRCNYGQISIKLKPNNP